MEKISRNGFSLAEAMIVILIGTIALGMSAPMISRQLKNETLTNTQMQIIQRQIEQIREQIREERTTVESGAVMFFRRTSCPEGWSVIKNKGGYYLRVAQVNNMGVIVEDKNIGDTIEAMVHKHKHVSPYLSFNNSAMSDTHRYGPYEPHNADIGGSGGDGVYPANPSSTHKLSGGGYSSASYINWFLYTSDGMNRTETLTRTRSSLYTVLTCPNRDEGDSICKPTGNQYDIPYLSEMPLVGNENRPKSILLLACEKD